MANKWNHLAKIALEFSPYHHDVEVGLLIGANCPRAIVPRKVIPGCGNEPYAQQTDLGWGIVGNVNELTQVNDEPTGKAHRIVTHVAVPRGERERRCTFSIKKIVKEVINPQQIRQMPSWNLISLKGAVKYSHCQWMTRNSWSN
jgi:hypothetical protein